MQICILEIAGYICPKMFTRILNLQKPLHLVTKLTGNLRNSVSTVGQRLSSILRRFEKPPILEGSTRGGLCASLLGGSAIHLWALKEVA